MFFKEFLIIQVLFSVWWTFKASCFEMNFVSHMSQWYGIMFSWRISNNSSHVFCLINLQSKLFWNELCITYVTMVWNHVFLKNFWWIKSCFQFEPSKLAVKMKFSMYGILFFLKNLPYHCEMCNKMFILTADI